MIEILKPQKPINVQIRIAGSKSITNRVVFLNPILKTQLNIQNLSNSEDSNNLLKTLQTIKHTTFANIDVKHAGTNMRFLTAYLCALPGEWIITGSERMKQRPISELVNALKQLGAQIEYLENNGFPPLKIKGQPLQGGKIMLNANISSQYISALLLLAPLLPDGLELALQGEIVSQPYINMTIEILKTFGLTIEQTKNLIKIHPKANTNKMTLPSDFIVESDWSSASYWYSICALSKNCKITLNTFNKNSLQADSILAKVYESLGVRTVFEEGKIILTNQSITSKKFEYNFIDCPDIAQTVAVSCFGLGIEAHLSGLSTLKIKETDRITALKIELEKLGAKVEANHHSIHVFSKEIDSMASQSFKINTYHDHRMALSFAPLALIAKSIGFEDERVIDKSYTQFWEDLKSAGFSVNLTP